MATKNAPMNVDVHSVFEGAISQFKSLNPTEPGQWPLLPKILTWALVALDHGIDIDTSSPTRAFTSHVVAAAAELERRLIGQRTKEALAIRREYRGAPRSPPHGRGRPRTGGLLDAVEWLDVAVNR